MHEAPSHTARSSKAGSTAKCRTRIGKMKNLCISTSRKLKEEMELKIEELHEGLKTRELKIEEEN